MKTQPTTPQPRALPCTLRQTLTAALLATLLLLLTIHSSRAGSATWTLSPTSGDWNTAANWTPATVPNGSADTATFAVSNTTGVSLSAGAEVNSMVFTSGASPFTITAGPTFALVISGTGVINNSAVLQNFVAGVSGTGNIGQIVFTNSATAGSQTVFTLIGGTVSSGVGGYIEFYGSSTAGNAQVTLNGGVSNVAKGGFGFFHDSASADHGTFVVKGGAPGGSGALLLFDGTSTAGNGTFVSEGNPPNGNDAAIVFYSSSSAGNANFTSEGAPADSFHGGETDLGDNATAANATFTAEGGMFPGSSGGYTSVNNNATAADATFTVNGGTVNGAGGGFLQFIDYTGLLNAPTAANATITINGGTTSGAIGGLAQFASNSTAENATLIANGGTGGGTGGIIQFVADSTGAAAQVKVFGNGNLDLSGHNFGAVTVGSLEGTGNVFLGTNNLAIGSNNLSTIFSGVIQDTGSLTKIGTGKLTLSGANTYTGGTTVTRGALLIRNTTGSGTGSGPVKVQRGTLAGTGTIAGSVLLGHAGILSPGSGDTLGTLAIQRGLSFRPGSIYDFALNSDRGASDSVIAKGVTINVSTISISDNGNTPLASGTVFTVINNTGTTPIAGTFSNLADGSTLIVGPNSFQANYEGGDGNDLTLTVVP